jgi:ABC-type multidrug transport system fused ATPase/permease subunit
VFEILGTPLPDPALPGPGPTGTIPVAVPDLRRQPIELRALSLRYPGRAVPALTGVNSEIRPGEHVLLAGPSGAGKSSLLSLLLRFTEPTSGEITAGGTSITQLQAGRWREQLAWVPQHPYLFAGTVAENIALGAPAATDAAVARAARLAGAEEFIRALPGGFGARLSERALNLSAGQRQRLALARAFLRDAPLVLLDEPVAHLDPATAADILTVITTLLAGRTVIMISHRGHLPADQVLTLEHGRLAVPAGVP